MEGPDAALVAALSAPWPMTARSRELALIGDALAGGARAVFVLGEPGCGKTRLAVEALAGLGAQGWLTATVTATEVARATPLGVLSNLVPGAAGASSVAAVGAARAALAAEEGQRCVVHVDDAHNLDPSSALVLAGLAEAGDVHLVATARLGTTLPDPLAALRRTEDVRSFTLASMGRAEVAELLGRVLGGPLDGLAEAALANLAGGNPLYLRELVIGGVADGSLRPVRGVWQLVGSLPAAEALGDVVGARLRALPPEALEALELVALGEPVGVGLMESLADLEALEHLEDLGLVTIEVVGRRHDVRLGHPLYGDLLRSSMDEGRLRRHSQRLAAAVQGAGARRAADLRQLVHWQIDAGLTPDPMQVLRSAEVARHHNDWLTAARLARVAYDAGLADAANLVAESHYALGEFEEGDLVAEPALREPGLLSDAALTSLHRTRAGVWFFGSRDPADALDAVLEASAQVSDPDLHDMLDYAQAAMCMWSGRVREARSLAEPLLEANDPKVRVQAAIAVETVASTAGPADLAVDLTQHWYGVHAGLADLNGTNSPAFHLLVQTEALVNAGQLERAMQLGQMGYELAVASHNRIAQMWFARELGQAALYRGDAAVSRRWLVEQVALCRGTAWLRPLALGLSELAIALVYLGDAPGAAAAIAERDGLGVAVIPLFATEGARGTAWAQAGAGDLPAARATLLDAVAVAEEAGIELLAALTRIDAFRLGAPGQREPLAQAAPRVGSETVAAAAAWVAAVDDDDPGAIEAAAGELERLGLLLHAAEACTAAAQSWRRRGDDRLAEAANLRAEGLRLRCDGAGGPMVAPAEGPVALTPREREIAVLAAEGLPSKEVAERLSVSPRTVSNHLQNVYTKLGVSKRAELSAALARLTLQSERP